MMDYDCTRMSNYKRVQYDLAFIRRFLIIICVALKLAAACMYFIAARLQPTQEEEVALLAAASGQAENDKHAVDNQGSITKKAEEDNLIAASVMNHSQRISTGCSISDDQIRTPILMRSLDGEDRADSKSAKVASVRMDVPVHVQPEYRNMHDVLLEEGETPDGGWFDSGLSEAHSLRRISRSFQLPKCFL